MTVSHPHSFFRTGTRVYTARPPANCRRARAAWDWFAKSGPVFDLFLLDGYWGARRHDGDLPEEIENTWSLDKERED